MATTGSNLPRKPASGHVAPLQRDCVFWEENKPRFPLPSYSTVPGPRANATVFLILNLYSHTSVWKRVEWMIFFFFHQFLPDLCEFLPSGQTVTSSISVFQGRRGGTKTGNHFKSLTVMITRITVLVNYLGIFQMGLSFLPPALFALEYVKYDRFPTTFRLWCSVDLTPSKQLNSKISVKIKKNKK